MLFCWIICLALKWLKGLVTVMAVKNHSYVEFTKKLSPISLQLVPHWCPQSKLSMGYHEGFALEEPNKTGNDG